MSNIFTIKSVNLFSSHVHNLPKNQECTICRCNLNVSSLHNQEKCIDSIITTGVCGHSFHMECINPWINQNKHCPLCSQKWQYLPTLQSTLQPTLQPTTISKSSISQDIEIE